jgi:hypothetical protein
MAKGRTYEMAFRIGGALARSFYSATSTAGAKLTELQRKSAALALQQQAAARFSAVGKAFNNVTSETVSLVTTVAGAAAAAAGGLFLLARGTANTGAAALRASQNLGLSVEAVQELWYAAQQTGLSTEQMDLAIRKMTVGIGRAAAGTGEAAKWFDQLGLSAHVLSAQSPDVAMETIADALNKIPDPAKRAAAAQAIFGEGALKLGVLLDKGSDGMRRLREEASKTGNVLSAKTAKESDAFNARLTALLATLAGLKNTIGAALLPAFTDLFTKLAAWLQTNNGRVSELAARFGEWATKSGPKLLELVQGLARLAERAYNAADATQKLLGGWDNLVIAMIAFKGLKVAWSVGELAVAAWSAAPALWAMSAAAWSCTAALLANPITWIVAGVLAEIAVITLAITYWDEWTGWLKKAGVWMDVLLGYLLISPAAPLALVLLLIKHWDSLVALWEGAKTAIVKVWDAGKAAATAFAAAVWGKVVAVFNVIKTVVLAAAEIWWIFFGPVFRFGAQAIAFVAQSVATIAGVVWGIVRPVLAVGWEIIKAFGGAIAQVVGFFVGLQLAIWGIVWEIVKFVGGIAWSIISPILEAFSYLWSLAQAGWALLAGFLTSLWQQWGGTVKAIIADVLAGMLNLLALPLRIGMALLNVLPGQDSPNLVKVRNTLNAAAQAGAGAVGMAVNTSGVLPTLETRQPLGAPLAGVAAQGRGTTQVNSPINLGGLTLNVNGGDPDAVGKIKQASDQAAESFAKQLQAFQEQQQRLAYG